jgi:hypothetical protein
VSILKQINNNESLIYLLKTLGAKTDFHFKNVRPKSMLETDSDVEKEESYKTTPLLHLVSRVPL